ncbi:MAG: hypothetical protein U0516_01900 [Candidatus Saccharibacteria bacterium]
MTTADEINVIFALVIFLSITKVLEVITNIVVALLQKRSYQAKYLHELEENSANKIELLKYKATLKQRILKEAEEAFKHAFEQNRFGEIDSYELREKYIAVYSQFSEECQMFEIDELQKIIDEMYAALLAALPEL